MNISKNKIIAGVATVLFFLSSSCSADDTSFITIIANPGLFQSIDEAAVGEEKVDWWDGQLTDDRACTECFAATQLAHFLTQITTFSKDDIVLESPGKLPSKGHVFLVGSRQSNPLIPSFNLPEGVELKTDESFTIYAVKQDGRIITVIEGKDRVGALYGVYAYLEQLGMRFYGLGEKEGPRAGQTVSMPYLLRVGRDSHNNDITHVLTEDYVIPKKGTVYPKEKVEPPDDIKIVENPVFLTRGYWAWEDKHGNEEFYLWMARNRMNFWTAAEGKRHLLKKLGINLTIGQHDIQYLFLNPKADYPYDHPAFKGDESKPQDPYAVGSEYTGDTNKDGKLTYFEAHPEWYCLINGKRSDNVNNTSGGDNYCTSNTDATIELSKNLIEALSRGDWQQADSVSFWMQDGGHWCDCQNCKQQGSYTDRMLAVIHQVMTETKKAQDRGLLLRNIQFLSPAYLETLAAPTRPLPPDFDYDNFSIIFFPIQRCYVHSFADPACTEINHSMLGDYMNWATGKGRYYKGSVCIGEYYNVSLFKSMPALYTRIMATDIPWYHRNGVDRFYYMHTPVRLWGTWTLNQYMLAQLLWDPDIDINKLLDEYFRLYYPTTSAQTRKFYHYLEKALENIGLMKNTWKYKWLGRLMDDSAEIFPLEHFHYETHPSLLNNGPSLVETIDLMRLARKELDAALLMCTDSMERQRLAEDQRRFAYGEAITYFYYHLVRTAFFHRQGDKKLAGNEFSRTKEYAKKLKNITDLVHVAASHANSENGLAATRAEKQYNFFKDKYDH